MLLPALLVKLLLSTDPLPWQFHTPTILAIPLLTLLSSWPINLTGTLQGYRVNLCLRAVRRHFFTLAGLARHSG